jgi:hypothetical protein
LPIVRPGIARYAGERLILLARALLFRQAPDRVSIVRTAEAGGSTLFVVEGPEPLAFSRDVTIEMFRRAHASPPPIEPELETDVPSRPFPGVLDAPAVVLRWLDSFEWVDGRLVGSALPRGLETAQRIILVGGHACSVCERTSGSSGSPRASLDGARSS